MTAPSVLVVDDDVDLLRALSITLRARGWSVATAPDGHRALDAVAETSPDVVVLDLGLPDLEGTEVVEGLRGWSSVPIVVLSARTDSSDKVAALDAGADDYVTKPFGMAELLARLRAAVRRGERCRTPGAGRSRRRHRGVPGGPRREAGGARRGQRRTPDPTEWASLEMLARHLAASSPKRDILREVWAPAT